MLLLENIQGILNELTWNFSRSSGKGGQNVNKVSTAAECRWNFIDSNHVSAFQKKLIKEKLKRRINSENVLFISSEKHRSQLKNRKEVESLLIKELNIALKKKKKRIPTNPTITSKEKRLGNKKRKSDIKSNRKPPKI